MEAAISDKPQKPKAAANPVAARASTKRKATAGGSSYCYTGLLTGGAEPDDLAAVYRVTEKGIPIKALSRFAESVEMFNIDFLLMKLTGLSERTIQRRLKSPEEALNSEQSARAIRGAQILDQAVRVIGTPELAESWMSKPAKGLDGLKPIDLLDNSIGAQLVSEFLTRLEYGVYQ
ncbi:MAG: antitoxin Xre/MbcA/ParS toxin-binding domain-containing protein [Pseudomonadota bacterium]